MQIHNARCGSESTLCLLPADVAGVIVGHIERRLEDMDWCMSSTGSMRPTIVHELNMAFATHATTQPTQPTGSWFGRSLFVSWRGKNNRQFANL